MAKRVPTKSKEAEEREAAAVLERRAKRKVGDFHALEELNLVPYLDVMMNLIIFMLVTIAAFLPLGILSIFPPASQAVRDAQKQEEQTPEEEKKELTLTLFITHTGFTFAGIGGLLPAIPMLPNGDYDFDTLNAKAVEIKDAYPNERAVIISADKDVPYKTLVKAMDTLRNKNERILFDNVKLGVLTNRGAQ